MSKLAHITAHDGFSLIELMVVVAVIGILSAIAAPNYQEYVLRSRLVDAVSSLAQLRVRMEQYFQDNRSYNADPSDAAGTTCGVDVSASNGRDFAYTCLTSNSGQSFTITASGQAGASTAAFVYTVDDANNRQTTAMAAGWGSAPATCWVSSRGQSC